MISRADLGPVVCQCGCGRPTKIAQQTNPRRGHVKGQPVRFINAGHANRRPLPERFWEKVDQSGGPNACSPWTGSKDTDGYGQIRVGGRTVKAHRLSWELHFGPIPAETPHVLHNCPGGDTPACVNPAHLWVGTNADNVRDMVAKGRNRASRGEKNGQARLVEEQVLEIRRIHAEERFSERRLALRFGVSQRTIGRIIAGRRWGHVLKEAV